MEGIHLVYWGHRDNRPKAIRDYEASFAQTDRDNAITLAGEIKLAQAAVVNLQTEHLQAVREWRRVLNTGAPAADVTAQKDVVDALASRLRDAQGYVEEMRAYARFFHRDYFTR